MATGTAPIARVYHCPHHPEHGVGEYRLDHPWRKPHPGMILQAASDLDLDLPSSAIIGDKIGDMQAGFAAGVGLRIRIGSGRNIADEAAPPHETVCDLAGALGGKLCGAGGGGFLLMVVPPEAREHFASALAPTVAIRVGLDTHGSTIIYD